MQIPTLLCAQNTSPILGGDAALWASRLRERLCGAFRLAGKAWGDMQYFIWNTMKTAGLSNWNRRASLSSIQYIHYHQVTYQHVNHGGAAPEHIFNASADYTGCQNMWAIDCKQSKYVHRQTTAVLELYESEFPILLFTFRVSDLRGIMFNDLFINCLVQRSFSCCSGTCWRYSVLGACYCNASSSIYQRLALSTSQ